MKIDFSNQWYREQCIENGLDPDNVLSQSSVEVAKTYSVRMKYWIDAKKDIREKYPDHWEELEMKMDEQIRRYNEERIGHMLNALQFAEIVKEWDPGFSEFLKKKFNRRQQLLKRRI